MCQYNAIGYKRGFTYYYMLLNIAIHYETQAYRLNVLNLYTITCCF